MRGRTVIILLRLWFGVAAPTLAHHVSGTRDSEPCPGPKKTEQASELRKELAAVMMSPITVFSGGMVRASSASITSAPGAVI